MDSSNRDAAPLRLCWESKLAHGDTDVDRSDWLWCVLQTTDTNSAALATLHNWCTDLSSDSFQRILHHTVDTHSACDRHILHVLGQGGNILQ